MLSLKNRRRKLTSLSLKFNRKTALLHWLPLRIAECYKSKRKRTAIWCINGECRIHVAPALPDGKVQREMQSIT